jgi:hypothetical protein
MWMVHSHGIAHKRSHITSLPFKHGLGMYVLCHPLLSIGMPPFYNPRGHHNDRLKEG